MFPLVEIVLMLWISFFVAMFTPLVFWKAVICVFQAVTLPFKGIQLQGGQNSCCSSLVDG